METVWVEANWEQSEVELVEKKFSIKKFLASISNEKLLKLSKRRLRRQLYIILMSCWKILPKQGDQLSLNGYNRSKIGGTEAAKAVADKAKCWIAWFLEVEAVKIRSFPHPLYYFIWSKVKVFFYIESDAWIPKVEYRPLKYGSLEKATRF